MINTVLIRRLAQSPSEKMRYSPNGVAVLPFTLAVNRTPSVDGTSRTDWIDCVAFQRTAEIMADHLEKGRSSRWRGGSRPGPIENQDGQKRRAVEVVAGRITFLEKKKTGEDAGTYNDGWKASGTEVD